MPNLSTRPEYSILKNAAWVWPDSHHWDIHNGYALFRYTFNLAKVPARSPLFITADQAYHLYINGRYVCRGPARGFQDSWPYDEVDVRAHLKKGRNVIAVRAYNPGFSTFQYISQCYAGLLIAASWGKTKINTGGYNGWKAIRQNSTFRDTVPTSMQLFSQEHIDLRKEGGDWAAPDFDDSAWEAPKEVRWNAAPWFGLEPRNIPMLAEREMTPLEIIGIQDGTSAQPYENVRDIFALRYREERGHQPAKSDFAPLAVAATGKGKFRSYLYDFGKTVVGNLTFTIDGAHGGEILDTLHFESINEATLTPDLIMPVHCRMAFGDRLTCRPGKNAHTFFHFYGFRYLCITVRDVIEPLSLQFKLNWVGYPFKRNGVFKSSQADLEAIWEICAWTQQCCSLDAYVDTPWREQAQWWGDARVQAWNTFHLDGDPRLFRRGIAQIAAQTTPDGVTYGHAPTMAHNCILPDFTLIWMLTLWDYYWQTGSTEPLLAHQSTITKALDYFRHHTDAKTGLVTFDERYWLFLDWTDLFKDGTPTVYNLWLLLALDKLALLYRKAKQPREAAPLEAWAKKLRTALQRLINKNGLLRDGIDLKGKIVESTSIHSQTLALMANLKGIDEKAIMEKILLPYIRGEYQPKVAPSSYWITYVFTVLIERGHGEEVIAFMHKHWLPMVAHGTAWEGFEMLRGNATCSHAWSAHPLYHLMQTVGGIWQTGPMWSEITFHPTFHGDHGEARVPTPHGFVHSQWKKAKDGKIDVKLGLPKGIKARVEFPGTKPQVIRQSGKWRVVLPA